MALIDFNPLVERLPWWGRHSWWRNGLGVLVGGALGGRLDSKDSLLSSEEDPSCVGETARQMQAAPDPGEGRWTTGHDSAHGTNP